MHADRQKDRWGGGALPDVGIEPGVWVHSTDPAHSASRRAVHGTQDSHRQPERQRDRGRLKERECAKESREVKVKELRMR